MFLPPFVKGNFYSERLFLLKILWKVQRDKMHNINAYANRLMTILHTHFLLWLYQISFGYNGRRKIQITNEGIITLRLSVSHSRDEWIKEQNVHADYWKLFLSQTEYYFFSVSQNKRKKYFYVKCVTYVAKILQMR